MPLNKEIWLPEIMEGFYPDDSFLKEARDLTAFVENDKINLAEAGINPDVLVNNTTYPVAVAERSDIPHDIELDYYDTTNTVIRNAEKAELSYDKRTSVIFGHKQALRVYFMQKAAHAYAPTADDTYTPVLTCTGATATNGFKKLKFNDIIDFGAKFDDIEVEEGGRILVLSTAHLADLRAEDMKLYKEILKDKEVFGFKLHKLAKKRMPIYDALTGQKKAYGAASTANDSAASFAFHKMEVMRADGSLDMFAREKDPEQRGDIIGFQKRGIAMPMRNKGLGAIYSPKA